MPANPFKPTRLGWALLILGLAAAYGLGTCQGRRQAENPTPARWFAPLIP